MLSDETDSKPTTKRSRSNTSTTACHQCEYRASTVERLQRHQRLAHGHDECVHKCTECAFAAEMASDLKAHMRRKHRNAQASNSAHASLSSDTLDEPKSEASSTKVPTISMSPLKSEFQNTTELTPTISRNKLRTFNCTLCDYVGRSSMSVTMHMRQRHKGQQSKVKTKAAKQPRTMKCAQCDYVAKTDAQLRHHEETAHKAGAYKCTECSFRSKTENGLKVHIGWRHTRSTTLSEQMQCISCDVRCRNAHQLRQHQLEAHRKCTQCAFVAPSLNQMRAHQWQHSGGMYSCPHCSQTFRSAKFRRAHLIEAHHIEEAPSSLQCNKCDFTTHAITSLRNHMRFAHTNARALQCTQCDATFKYPFCLKRHMNTMHEGIGSHGCPLCDAGFRDGKRSSVS